MSRLLLLSLLLTGVVAASPVDPATKAAPPASAEYQGLFQYLADAALFTDCRSGQRYPVAMEQAYLELERAYLAAGSGPGEPVLVRVRGHIERRPGMEANRPVATLVLEAIGRVGPGQECGPLAAMPLSGTRWRLFELGGTAVAPRHPQHTPEILLDPRIRSVSGYSGCNRFRGQFTQDGEGLRFSSLAGTLRACVEEAAMERNFFDALKRTERFRITDGVLELRHGDTTLARLRAAPH